MTIPREDNLRARARRVVIARSIYKGVMSIWVIVAIGLIAIWYLTTPNGYFWPIWPITTMAVAATIWGLVEYGKSPFRVTERQVEREFQKLKAEAG